jgi:RNA polymerase sigma-70 factor, ECF subfamily
VEDLKRAIVRLTPEQRAPLVLRELEGCSYEEIAEALELSIPAVKSRLHRARLELLAAMREWA